MKHHTDAEKAETCDVKAIHEDIVAGVSKKLPEHEMLQELAALFKVFGDGTRLSILWALSESEMCVCDVCALLNLKQSAVSHQLNKLKASRIVKNRREGKVVFYSLSDEHIRMMLEVGMGHVSEP
jgi:ArsR family transcriptional regulator